MNVVIEVLGRNERLGDRTRNDDAQRELNLLYITARKTIYRARLPSPINLIGEALQRVL